MWTSRGGLFFALALNGFGCSAWLSERRHDDKYGVLLLALEADRARWRFITPAGETVDEGTVECHGRPESPR
jgi:hypothetical protein